MQKLKTVDADTLLSTPLPANQFVVERLLPQGLHILAGASKVGKSWLALWLCLCVAKGEPVQPSVLSKKLARYAGELDKLGVHITTSRTRESRSLHLRHCEGLCARSAPRAGETPSQAMQRPFGRFVPGVEHPGIYSRFGAIYAGRYVSRIKR